MKIEVATNSELWRHAGFALWALSSLGACTTYLRPAECHGGPYRCEADSDVKFCESQVVASEGSDCASLGLAPAEPFCVVTNSGCHRTTYEVTNRSCRVSDYLAVAEGRECSPRTPTFLAP
jgi:hypothetical protein